MSNLSLHEKLMLVDEKNLLIQGIPSSIEKMFAKLSYAKNVTPLVKNRKVDFVLVFAINKNQLMNIMKEVLPATKDETKLWVAFPKLTSKIVSDLNRESSWDFFTQSNYQTHSTIDIDHMWSATRFTKIGVEIKEKTAEEIVEEKQIKEKVKSPSFDKKLIAIPSILEKIFTKNKEAKQIFSALAPSHQNEYLTWIDGAKKDETKLRRSESVVEKLMAGKKSPMQK